MHRSKFPNLLRFPCYLSNFLNSIKHRGDSRPEIDYTFNVQLFQIRDKAYVCHYWKPSYRLWFSDQASGEFIDGKRKHKSGGKRNINAFCHLRRKILWKVYLSCFLVPRPANMFQGCARLMRTMLPYRFHKYSTFARHQYNPQINSFAAVSSIYPVN